MNGAKGHSALQLSRDLDCQYKTAFVLAHKIREAIAAEKPTAQPFPVTVEVDGAYFGGYVKPANYKENRAIVALPRTKPASATSSSSCASAAVARSPFVFKTEAAGVATIAARRRPGTTVHADEATHWDALHARFLTKRINHSEAYST